MEELPEPVMDLAPGLHPLVVSYLSAIKLPLKMSRQKYISAAEWGGIPTGCQTRVLTLLAAAVFCTSVLSTA